MLKFSDLIVYPSQTLRSALQRMTQNRHGILFVCDEDGHMIGAISDGDVRRSLLDNTLLISPVEKVMNTDPVSASTSQEAAELLRRLNIVAVPVVDRDGIIHEIVVEKRESVLILSRESDDPGVDTMAEIGALAIIPARGGSKRIQKKNLATVGGKSLLALAVQAAKNAELVSRVLISTDDAEIANAARAMGVEVPWLRPESLSTDTAQTIDVLLHALKWAVENLNPAPEVAVLLEPTSPFRQPEQINEAISLLLNSDADCVASVCELPHIFHPEEVLLVDDGGLRPYLPGRTMDSRRLRNDQGRAYVLNGLVYAFRVQSALAQRSIFGRKTLPLIAPWDSFIDIDTPEDLEFANFKIGRSVSHA